MASNTSGRTSRLHAPHLTSASCSPPSAAFALTRDRSSRCAAGPGAQTSQADTTIPCRADLRADLRHPGPENADWTGTRQAPGFAAPGCERASIRQPKQQQDSGLEHQETRIIALENNGLRAIVGQQRTALDRLSRQKLDAHTNHWLNTPIAARQPVGRPSQRGDEARRSSEGSPPLPTAPSAPRLPVSFRPWLAEET